jgi:BlaR1 peptidase M56
MIEYIIKSTICLVISYGFYHLVLRNLRSFIFNRYYLLFSLMFAILLPFLHIRVGIALPVVSGIESPGFAVGELVGGLASGEVTASKFSLDLMLQMIYLAVSLVFFIRYSVNVMRILRKTRGSVSVPGLSARLCLLEGQSLPYSFLNSILVNRSDYEKGMIEEELLIHEEAHCRQHHSLDILFVEFLKTIAWFNPLIWIFKKAIQLNHEYLADQAVILNRDADRYQGILINLVLGNHSAYLASDFNFSLTKKRLKMMALENLRDHSVIKRFAAIPLFLLLAAGISFSQESKFPESVDSDVKTESVAASANDWWKPILERHGIVASAYNNFEYVFEMGSSNSIENSVVTLTDAFFLIRESENLYTFIKSPLATHDLESNMIKGSEAIFESYDTEKGIVPTRILEMTGFEYQISKAEDGSNVYTALQPIG